MPAEPPELYELALTHRSFAFEQPEVCPHNERLEFLGDAVLGAVVTDMIYRRFPNYTEGQMARLRASVVNTRALAALGRSLGLGEHIRLGKGEEASGGRDKASLLANTFEALVGALYLDKGLEGVRSTLEPLFVAKLAPAADETSEFDAKTVLQEVAMRDRGMLPSYRVAASGPDHDKRFQASVHLEGRQLGSGRGTSKKEAEQNAAREALRAIEHLSSGSGGSDARAS